MSDLTLPATSPSGQAPQALPEDQRFLEVTALVDRLAEKAARFRDALAEKTRLAEALEQQLAVTEARLMVETMHAAGLAAQATFLLSMGPEAASQPAEAAYEDGSLKTRLALTYEEAFDAKGRELGVEEPARFRAN